MGSLETHQGSSWLRWRKYALKPGMKEGGMAARAIMSLISAVFGALRPRQARCPLKASSTSKMTKHLLRGHHSTGAAGGAHRRSCRSEGAWAKKVTMIFMPALNDEEMTKGEIIVIKAKSKA